MPVYFFWGEDEYRLTQAVSELRKTVIDPVWGEFNEDIIAGEKPEAVMEAINQALTPPLGGGGRLVWVQQTTIGQQCSDELLSELQRSLPQLPDTSHLLFTSDKKPDGRLKVTKLLKEYATIQEFSLIPPWKTEQLLAQVETMAHQKGVSLTTSAKQQLVNAIGNDTRLLAQELEKLSLYPQDDPLDESAIAQLVSGNTHHSLQLAKTIRDGDTNQALTLLNDLLNRNEPALKIVAVLVGQFRTWFWVKLMLEKGERDQKVIAQAAEVHNPKRVYFLRQEVQGISLQQFVRLFPILLQLEAALKQGENPQMILETKLVELCKICQ